MTFHNWAASLIVGALVVSAPGLGALAAPAAPAAAYKAPRNAYGQPDFSGTWNNSSLTPFQRSPTYADRATFTDEEVQSLIQAQAKRQAEQDKPLEADAPAATDCGLDCPYGNSAWGENAEFVTIRGENRTSVITKPANGRIPALIPSAQAWYDALRKTNPHTYRLGGQPVPPGSIEDDNPETRSLGERCLTSFGNHAGPVMSGGGYNSNYKFMQSQDALGIVVEMPHDQRIVRIGGKHPASHIRYWHGDTIGWWDGDTLVAETTNYRADQTNFHGSRMVNLKVVERFTRVGPDRLLYQFEVSDPDTWAETWGGEYEFTRAKGAMYEYACHEGNYGLKNMLAGAQNQGVDKN